MGGWTYILRCSDRSLYVGSTSYNAVEHRIAEHNDARYPGYTAARRPVALVWAKWFDDLRDAHETERRLKGWSRAKKEALIAGNEQKLKAHSVRRGGKLPNSSPHRSKRDLNFEAQAAAAKFGPRFCFNNADLRRHKERTPHEAEAAKRPLQLIADSFSQPEVRSDTRPLGRHPEVRARAKRRGSPEG